MEKKTIEHLTDCDEVQKKKKTEATEQSRKWTRLDDKNEKSLTKIHKLF